MQMYCACDRETAVKRNSATYGAGVEGATLIGQLFDRFEEPSAFARWDTPLLRVNVHDDSPPVAAIETALFGVVPPPPNLSTVVVRALLPCLWRLLSFCLHSNFNFKLCF